MKVINCPECKAPLKVVYSKQAVSGWKTCGKCDHPSLIVAPEEGEAKVASLRGLINKIREQSAPRDKLGAIGIFEYILKKGSAGKKDLIFHVGKEVETGIGYYRKYGILEGNDPYRISGRLEPYVVEEIRRYIPKEDLLSILE